jgi:hypothetical protein
MIRTLNYTGRKKIFQSQIKIEIEQHNTNPSTLKVKVNLEGLELPPKAPVYIEAHAGSSITGLKRFVFGNVGNPGFIDDTSLEGLGEPQNLIFKVLVVDESGTLGKILASADMIKPLSNIEYLPILPVQTKDLGQQVWRIDFNDEGPVLTLNYNIPDVKNISVSDPRFFEYIYPEAFKEILYRIIFIDGTGQPEDLELDDWRHNWLVFADLFFPNDQRPVINNEDDIFDPEAARLWIDHVIKGFCSVHTPIWEKLLKDIEEGH